MTETDPLDKYVNPQPDLDLIGPGDIAKLCDVSTQAVYNWRQRFGDFPAPVAKVASGPIFSAPEVLTWLRVHGKLADNKAP